MSVEEVLGKLEGVRRSGKGWVARCPVHGDRHPSLSIGTGYDGAILLHCHAGCETEDVVASLGLEMGDLFSLV